MPTPDQGALTFGAWATAVHGLDNIEREQWRNVWPRIRWFTFVPKPEVLTEGDTATQSTRHPAVTASGKILHLRGRRSSQLS